MSACAFCGIVLVSTGKRGRPARACSDACRAAIARRRYNSNRDVLSARSRAWQKANPERYTALLEAWRGRHPQYMRLWRMTKAVVQTYPLPEQELRQ